MHYIVCRGGPLHDQLRYIGKAASMFTSVYDDFSASYIMIDELHPTGLVIFEHVSDN